MASSEIKVTETIRQIKALIEEYAGDPDGLDSAKVAVKIYDLTQLCPKCGASLAIWKELFNEEHECPTKEEVRNYVYGLTEYQRRNMAGGIC